MFLLPAGRTAKETPYLSHLLAHLLVPQPSLFVCVCMCAAEASNSVKVRKALGATKPRELGKSTCGPAATLRTTEETPLSNPRQ